MEGIFITRGLKMHFTNTICKAVNKSTTLSSVIHPKYPDYITSNGDDDDDDDDDIEDSKEFQETHTFIEDHNPRQAFIRSAEDVSYIYMFFEHTAVFRNNDSQFVFLHHNANKQSRIITGGDINSFLMAIAEHRTIISPAVFQELERIVYDKDGQMNKAG